MTKIIRKYMAAELSSLIFFFFLNEINGKCADISINTCVANEPAGFIT
jgi:hypothetical protein